MWSKLLCLTGEGSDWSWQVWNSRQGTCRQPESEGPKPHGPSGHSFFFFNLLVDPILSCYIHLFTQHTCAQSLSDSYTLFLWSPDAGSFPDGQAG